MKPIAEYQNYRSVIQDFYDEHKSRGMLTWRGFSELAGFASSGYLKLVCQGKANLSDAGIQQVAKAMKLTPSETAYFKELVLLDQAKTVTDKDKSLKNLEKLSKSCKARVLRDDSLDYFSNWQNAVVRELAPKAPANAKTSNIARQVLPEITAAEVGRALKFLTATGMLVKNEDGSFTQTDKVLTSGNKDLSSVALRSFHKQLGKLAIDSLDNVPVNERNSSDLVIGITAAQYEKLVQKIIDFRREVLDVVTETDDMERVYCLQMNLFPLSHKISTKGNPDEK
ncbi:TIGR02147 family protein [Fibrobacter sp. UWEL]|uniref:TIGR02147 family protein n=1 Tax=Fibrobacter sp. UWEL TaxID=1896209 RepID=UPI00091A5167|nr:TIGR02147 family protein [Fibrobacter sp. UWEL]SHL30334.1 TIGR02147 family protein [Fibrobacter sp. UWEL]